MRQGHERAVVNSPKIRLEKTAAILLAHFLDAPVNGHARIVNPSVDATEPVDSSPCDSFHFGAVSDITGDKYGLAAGLVDLVCNFCGCALASCSDDEFCTALRR